MSPEPTTPAAGTGPARVAGFGTGVRVAGAANAAILIGLAFALLVVVNVIASRAYTRWDWTHGGAYQLSERTRTFLRESLDAQPEPLKAYVFYPPWRIFALSTRRDEVYAVHQLAREYALASSHVVIETLDPEQNRGRVDQLRRQFEISDAEFGKGVVAFAFGHRTKYLTDHQLFETDVEALRASGGGRELPRRFVGEDRFTAAIQGLVLGTTPTAAVLVGHGELDPKSTDERQAATRVEQALKRDTYEVDVLDLQGFSVIRKDYDVICILGPRLPLPPTTIAALRAHLDRGGGLLVCVAPNIDQLQTGQVVYHPTGLEPLLEEWGVHLQEDLVLASQPDPSGHQRQYSEYFTPTMDPEHPITRSLTMERGRLIPFRTTRSVRYDDRGRGRTQGWTLAHTDPQGRAVTDFVGYFQALKDYRTYVEFAGDDRRHRPGEQPVGVAVQSLTPAAGTGREVRLVVFGSIEWCDDIPPFGLYELDLFLNAANWIARRDSLVGIGAKDPDKVRFAMSDAQKRLVFWLGIVFLPIGIGLLGALVYLVRKREALPAAPAAAGERA